MKRIIANSMVVLSGSINVSELLAGGDLDESSPLSVPNLRLLVDRLQIRSLRIKHKVRSYVLAHHADFADLFFRCFLADDSTDDFSHSFFNALGILSDRLLNIEIEALASEIHAKRRELEEQREALEVVRTLSAIHRRLTSAREDLRAGKLVAAAEAVRDLKRSLMFMDEKDEGGRVDEPVVFGCLRKEWADCFDELEEVLAKTALNCVRFEPECSKLIVGCASRVGYVPDINLRQVLEAMEIVGSLDYGLGRVADLVIKHVMVPAITTISVKDLFKEHHEDSNEHSAAILKIVSSSEL